MSVCLSVSLSVFSYLSGCCDCVCGFNNVFVLFHCIPHMNIWQTCHVISFQNVMTCHNFFVYFSSHHFITTTLLCVCDARFLYSSLDLKLFFMFSIFLHKIEYIFKVYGYFFLNNRLFFLLLTNCVEEFMMCLGFWPFLVFVFLLSFSFVEVFNKSILLKMFLFVPVPVRVWFWFLGDLKRRKMKQKKF